MLEDDELYESVEKGFPHLFSLAEEVTPTRAGEGAAENSLSPILGGPSLVGEPSGAESNDGSQETGARSSTKMRTATLAYLCQFWADPGRLEEEFSRLLKRPDLHILHLCGCGLCQKVPSGPGLGGTRILGCTEPTHLKLGTSEENSLHTSMHRAMNAISNDGYPTLVGLYQQGVAEVRELM